MVLNTTREQDIINTVVSYLNGRFTHMTFGSGTTTPSSSNTDVTTSILTKTLEEKDTSVASRIVYTAKLELSEGNTNTIGEIAIKDGASGNNLQHDLVPTAPTKTSTKEIFVDYIQDWSIVEV